MQVYGKVNQDNVDEILKQAFPVWSIRLFIYKGEDLYHVFTFHDTAYLPTAGLPSHEQFTACVEYVGIRGEVLSTCGIERVPFWSASASMLGVIQFHLN